MAFVGFGVVGVGVAAVVSGSIGNILIVRASIKTNRIKPTIMI